MCSGPEEAVDLLLGWPLDDERHRGDAVARNRDRVSVTQCVCARMVCLHQYPDST
jgi:hypothetical protein